MGSPTQALIELNSETKLDISYDHRLNAVLKGGRSRTGTYVDSLIIDVSTFQELKDRETDLRQQLHDVSARLDDGAATLSDNEYDALQSRQTTTQSDLDKVQQQLAALLDITIRGAKTNELHIDYNLVKGLRAKGKLRFVVVSLNAAAEVQQRMVRIDWFGQRLLFSSVNGAADSLRAVARDISRHPEYRKYMSQSSTFYWRKVRGAQRQSAHSYGIAIDINVGFSNYWLWTNRGAKETDRIRYENRIPQGLVHIFERHGFIWGGRWYHYDTMHFEFRPEFL